MNLSVIPESWPEIITLKPESIGGRKDNTKDVKSHSCCLWISFGMEKEPVKLEAQELNSSRHFLHIL